MKKCLRVLCFGLLLAACSGVGARTLPVEVVRSERLNARIEDSGQVARIAMAFFQSPLGAGRLVAGDEGAPYLLSASRGKGGLLDLRSGNVVLESGLLRGINTKAMQRSGDGWLVAVDYWPGGGSSLRGLFRLHADGGYEKLKLAREYNGLGDLVRDPDGGWWFTDFEADDVWHFEAEGRPEKALLTDPRPKGLIRLAWHPEEKRLYAANGKGAWLDGKAAIYCIDDGKAVKLRDIGQAGGIAWNPGGVFPRGLYFTDRDRGTVERIDTEGGATTLISGLSSPSDLLFDHDGTLWVVAAHDVVWRFAPRDAQPPAYLTDYPKGGRSVPGGPLAEAVVRIDERTTVTDEHGKVLLAGMAPGEHSFVARHPGYFEFAARRMIEDDDQPLRIALTPVAEHVLKGDVASSDGQALIGALLRLTPIESHAVPRGPYVFASDAEGRFTIVSIGEGDYRLEVSAPGHAPLRRRLRIPLDDEAPLHLQLQRDGSLSARQLQEPDSPSRATPLAPGQRASGRIEQRGDIDWLRVHVERPGQLLVSMSAHPDMQQAVHLHTGDAGVLLAEKSAYVGSSLRLEQWVSAGDYLISVHEWGDNNASQTPYHLQLDLIPDDGVDDPPLISPALRPDRELRPGERVGATIWPLHDKDLYRIDLPGAGELRLSARAPLQIQLALFDRAGKSLAEKGTYKGRTLHLKWQSPGPRSLILEVSEWGNNNAAASPYVVSATWLPADSLDALQRNDSLASATPVRDRVLLRGNILPLGDRDLYRVETGHPGLLRVRGEGPPDKQLQVRLLDAKGQESAKKGVYAGQAMKLDADILPGVWYVEVREWGDNESFAQDYRLHLDLLRAEPEESVPLADDPVRMLKPHVARTFRIDQLGDRDRFAFVAPATGEWWLNLIAPFQVHARVSRNGDAGPLLERGWYQPTRGAVPLKLKQGDRLLIELREWGDNSRSLLPGSILISDEAVELGLDRLRALPDPRPGRARFVREAIPSLARAQRVEVDADADGHFDLPVPRDGGRDWRYPRPALYQARVRQSGTDSRVGGMLDGRRAKPGSRWNALGNTYWRDRERRFVVDLGKPVGLHDLRLQLDNNDSYRVEHSLDGKRFQPLLEIPASAGKIHGGIDSFSTLASDPEYIAGIDFEPLRTRYLRISALDGDGYYAVAELTPLDAAGRPLAAHLVAREWPLEQRIWVDARGGGDETGLVAVLDGLPDSGLLERAGPVTVHARPSRGARIEAVRFVLDGKPLARLVAAPFQIEPAWEELGPGRHRLEIEISDSRGRHKRLEREFRLASHFGLTPADGAELSGENVRVSWIGNAFGAARVEYRRLGEQAWKTVVGENGRRRSVLLRGLEPGNVYQFRVRDNNGASPVRRFKLLKGLAFGKAAYGATIRRDYDQRLAISVRNNGEQPLQVRLECGRPADERLLVGFVGEGSEDEPVDLAPGEERRFWLGISAQDVISAEHHFPIRIRAAGGLSDEAQVNLNVRLPRVRLRWEDLGPTVDGIGRRLRLRNRGDRLTDLKVGASGGAVELSPSIQHGLLAVDGHVDLIARPLLARGVRRIETRLLAEAAGKRFEHPLVLGAAPGEQVLPLLLSPDLDPERDPFDYQRQLGNRLLAGDLEPDAVVWDTTAKGRDQDGDGRADRWEQYDELDDVRWVGDDTDGDGRVDFVHADKGDDGLFELSAFRDGKGWRRTNLVEGWLEMGFSLPWSRSAYRKHDVDIVFNGEVIGSLRDTIPNGNYRFIVPPRLVRFDERGKPAGNRIGIQSKHLRGGHYVVNSDFRFSFRLTGAQLWSSGADLGDAYGRLSRTGGISLARPDYSVSSSHFELVAQGELEADREYPLRARLGNLGAAAGAPVSVVLFDSRAGRKPVEVARQRIRVPIEGETPVAFQWRASPGAHELSLVIDPERKSADLERANNRALLDVSVPGDPEPPRLRVIRPADGVRLDAPVAAIEAEASDDIQLARVEASIDGGLWQALMARGGGRFGAGLLLQPGEHRIEVRAADAADNLTHVARRVKVEAPVGKTRIVFPEAGSRIPVRYVDVVIGIPPGTRHAAVHVDGMPWYAARISYRNARARLPLRFGSQRIEVLTIDDRGVASRDAIEVECTRQPRPSDKPPRGARLARERIHIDGLGWIDLDAGLNTLVVETEPQR